ncbi:hypothetical protein PPL_11386 [Heterostelium album PN500]|uniref:Protein kinase domain-containing protein n=1 Tax=Heterostelium pallidum (strain ATCC 26659 / Pp 5 / PN500) TaxID=670386 RepID=D3BT93_HETP5|nr:hypothetical protein PPL_11386 [Heterostelium album PN500]EFA75310.1 hypothetical protein PPL_11386 [Heterostelium album PN500]|eukprot:XP_020427444.1 hypothetical protein PPL_11386 [Heterostelium album PN500]
MDTILQQWKISSDDIQLIELIESKSNSMVYRGLVRGQEALIKRIDIERVDDSLILQMINEAYILSTLRNPNIVLFMGLCLTHQHLQIITEYMPKGSFKQLIKQQQQQQATSGGTGTNPLEAKLVLKIANDVVLAMNWLHHQPEPIIHLNLKPNNILLGNSFSAKLADFRLCRLKTSENTVGQAGSGVAYMAPEVLLNKPFDERCDVYSFGITLWEMLAGRDPYSDNHFTSYPQLIDAITDKNIRPPLLTWFPPRLCELLNNCWSANPADRPSFQSIIEHRLIDRIIVDLLVPVDLVAREFWVNNFLGRTSVNWELFIHRFAVYFGIDLNVYALTTRIITSDPGCYAVSYVGKAKEINNCKVHYRHPDGYQFPGGSNYYPTFEKILQSHPKGVFKIPILESKFNLIENILLQTEGPTIYTQLAPNRKV